MQNDLMDVKKECGGGSTAHERKPTPVILQVSCSACDKCLPASEFSKSQLKKKITFRCQNCVREEREPRLKCSRCSESLPCSNFSPSQLKYTRRACTKCVGKKLGGGGGSDNALTELKTESSGESLFYPPGKENDHDLGEYEGLADSYEVEEDFREPKTRKGRVTGRGKVKRENMSELHREGHVPR